MDLRPLAASSAPSAPAAPAAPIFTLRPQPSRLPIPSNDTVTAVAATGGLLWVGTHAGRLIRHDPAHATSEQVRGRLGVGRLDNAVWRIYPDPYTFSALIILRNADGYLAHGRGLVRPRWLAKLRGLHCVSATWLRLPSSDGDRSVALLGTAFGALFSLLVDRKYERDDTLTRLWSAPHSEHIHGIRVEQVAGKFVATVATTTALFLFSDALSLADLFVDDNLTVVNRSDTSSVSDVSHDNLPLPADIQFMTGSSGISSRRLVWAAASGITHAQLAVRRRRTDSPSQDTPTNQRATRSTVIVSLADRDTLSWDTLERQSRSSVPLACNLTAFHVLVLYPGSISAFNHISGQLTQQLTLWNPLQSADASSDAAVRSVGDRTSESETGRPLLSSPAAGFARDVLVDCLWVYTEDGEVARINVSQEEQTEAWKAAKAMGRFDLAMALAPLVSNTMATDAVIFQTREAVLEAQADHASSKGDWDVAAQLYAKTKRPIESVILRIVDACRTSMKDETKGSAPPTAPSTKMENANLRALGVDARLQTVKHLITYLVRKLDGIDANKPMQRTIMSTLLVQLYSTQLSAEPDGAEREEVRKDFGNFLADRHQDLHIDTALDILSKNGCNEEAWNLAVLSGNVLSACEMSTRRGHVDPCLSLLKNGNVLKDGDVLNQLIGQISIGLTAREPRRVMTAMSRCLRKDSEFANHMTVVQGLACVARDKKDAEKSEEAYQAATGYLFDVLSERGRAAAKEGEGKGIGKGMGREWYKFVTVLFMLHAECGSEEDAQRSYDELIAPHVSGRIEDMGGLMENALGVIVRCATVGKYRRLCVHVYQALGMYERAVSLACGMDLELAEAVVGQVGKGDVGEVTMRKLWCMVARESTDPVGVVERSKGVLHIEDVLNDMEPFESASERVKNAVADSLQEHKRLANVAKKEAVSALEVTKCLRVDVERTEGWREERTGERQGGKGGRGIVQSCGHRVRVRERGVSGDSVECGLCGDKAIGRVDGMFDSGLALPVRK